MSDIHKPVVLIIRDGWGENHDHSYDAYNAVKLANTPIADELTAQYPRTEIHASGLAVGLPKGIMGNSEVGHQNTTLSDCFNGHARCCTGGAP